MKTLLRLCCLSAALTLPFGGAGCAPADPTPPAPTLVSPAEGLPDCCVDAEAAAPCCEAPSRASLAVGDTAPEVEVGPPPREVVPDAGEGAPEPAAQAAPPGGVIPVEEEEASAPLPAPDLPGEGTFKALNKANTLYLQTLPNKSRRVWVKAEVCLREGPLEVFLCRKGTKEHESVVAADLDARMIHAALLATGAKPGSPVQYVPEYRPAVGSKVRVLVYHRPEGKDKPVLEPAQEWVLDIRTQKPMREDWVFAGSRLLKDPDDPAAPPYYTANNGEIISVSNFVDSMLDLPVESSREQDQLLYQANTRRIPPLFSQVWVVLEPLADA